jgi:hypothetical protein
VSPTDDDVTNWTPKDLKKYFSSKVYHNDNAIACPTPSLKPPQRAGSYDGIRGTSNCQNVSGASSIGDHVAMHEFQKGEN